MGKIHKFPVQTQMNVYEDDFKSAFVNDKEWKKLNEQLKAEILSVGDKNNHKTNVKADMTSQMRNKSDSFKRLEKWIDEKIDQYMNLILGGFPIAEDGKKVNLQCQDIWGVIYRKGDWTQDHNHTGSVFSFSYYVQAEGNCAPFVFTHPGLNLIKPKTGLFLIWDSVYRHMVPPHESDTPRIMIAGNIHFDKAEKFTESE